MNRFYSQFRVMLMTFALGSASVFIFDGSLSFSNEMPVNLPKVKTGNVIIVSPKRAGEIPKIGEVVVCNRRILTDEELKELK